jgi:hypothetical protein
VDLERHVPRFREVLEDLVLDARRLPILLVKEEIGVEGDYPEGLGPGGKGEG